MVINLCCPKCPCRFSADADAPADEVLGRMTEDAPWFALAEGETFGEMVVAALQKRGRILCPDCRGQVGVETSDLAEDRLRKPAVNRPAIG